MTLAQLRSSRALWRRREISRYGRWRKAKKAADKSRYYRLYIEARDARRERDRQIAKATPKAAHTVSASGVALVAQFEGFRSHTYRDAVGVPTIGYGETMSKYVRMGTISEPAARALLKVRLITNYLPAVLAAGRGKLNQHQIDAFTSFVYNCGTGAVGPNTTVGKLLRAGRPTAAADGLLAWSKAGGRVLPGLLARRQAERRLAKS